MSTKNHIILIIICLSIWLLFFILGLPNNHYQNWTIDMQIIHCGDIILLIWPLVHITLKKLSYKDFFHCSLWFAFYASMPFILLDYIYLNIIKGYSMSYLVSHWYLTIFYFIVWIEMPLIGYFMEKKDKKNKILFD